MDYQDLIDELKDEVGTGSLSNDEAIQVLRNDQAQADGYQAIIDWYYNDPTMTIELAPEDSDTAEDLKDKQLLQEQYSKDQAKLEVMTVAECLSEITSKHTPKAKKNSNPFF